jgi:hypothetical protein
MELSEARQILWLKSNLRPMGELFDEGYLTIERLEWAAKWAYNPRQKEAAQVLLASLNTNPKLEQSLTPHLPTPELQIGMTLEQAHNTAWPFGTLKGQPMGTLINSKQLSLKDLGYAIETAWDVRVKQAAIALTLTRLEQVLKEPPPPAGQVHIVSAGKSYAQKQETRLTLIQGLIFGMVFGAGFAGFIMTSVNRPETGQSVSVSLISPGGILLFLLAILMGIGFGGLLFWLPERISKRLDKEIQQYRLGQEGEDLTIQVIAGALDGNWHVFRNVSLPGRNQGDLDIVLLGPSGVWVLEVKNFRGEYKNQGEDWEFRRGNKWVKGLGNPSRQVIKNAVRLSNFLKVDRLEVFVNPAIVWVNQQSQLEVQNPRVPIWRLERLPDELGNIWQGEKISTENREKIARKLTLLCEEQKKKYEMS